MADSYVCSGALMKCSMGTSPARLTVLPNRMVFLAGQLMANVSDHQSMVNLAPFGLCRSMGFPNTASATAAAMGTLTPTPCIHNTPAPWTPGKDDYLIKGRPALLYKSSTCQCMWGGTITLLNNGQVGEGAQGVYETISEQSEMPKITEGQTLDSKSVLDGIQLALDVAGFAPGVGAIPDLMNASISALRGNWGDAGLSLLAAVPLIGDVAAGVKIAKKGKNIAKMAQRSISRNVDVSIKGLVKRGMSVEEAKAFRKGVRNERRNAAKKFYKENTKWTDEKIEAHLQGIDFNKPIKVDKLPPPGQKEVTVYQYRNLSEKTGKYEAGNYFTTNPNATPSELGIADSFSMNISKAKGGAPQQLGLPFTKVKYSGKVTEEIPCLRTTARRVEDTWSMTGQSVLTKGGGEQLFVPNNSFASNMAKY